LVIHILLPLATHTSPRCPAGARKAAPPAAAAEFLRHRHAQQAELSHARPQVHGELVAAVDLVRQRRDFISRKARHGVAQQVEFFIQMHVECHRQPPPVSELNDR
jgi:hypothetical protein